jgi:hypothetical protein
MVILTRYLYSKDEVQFSLIYSILERKDFKESLFWFSELYYSGYENESWNLLFEIYYNFYARRNPKLEKIFIKLYKDWKDENDIKHILHVLKNLFFNSKKDSICYEYFKMIGHQKTKTKSYRGRPPAFIKELNIDKKYKDLIMSIHKKNFTNMMYYLNRFQSEKSEIYSTILKYFKQNKKISLKNNDYQTIIDHPYQNKIHILLSLVFHLMTDESEINTKSIYMLISNKELEYTQQTNITNSRLYRHLREKRHYKIRTNIGCFPLERYEVGCIAMNKILWDHWEYFAYTCPLWNRRFNKYNIEVDNVNKKIIFKEEEEQEDFYERYNYEPDEQSSITQEKSTTQIEKIERDCYIYILSKDG